MGCPSCEAPTISFSVPADYREYVPEEPATAAFCPRCLTLESSATDRSAAPGRPADSRSATDPDFSRVSDAFPTDPGAAVPLALALGLCSSLATNREAIETLLRDVERAGVDPLLVIDRLVADPDVDPAVDLKRRAHQLEQLLY